MSDIFSKVLSDEWQTMDASEDDIRIGKPMSDDLVKQLRNSKGWPTLGNAAADHIEELESKLAKAVATLEMVVGGTVYTAVDGFSQPYEPEQSRIARSTLAELKGRQQ